MVNWELKKLCTRFTVTAVLVLILLNLASVFLLYAEEGTQHGILRREARAELMDDYHHDRGSYDTAHDAYSEQYREYQQWVMYGDGSFTWVNRNIDLEDYGDRQLWDDVLAEINRAEEYNADIAKVLREAYTRLRELGSRRGEYTYEYQVNLILHYEKLANMEIIPQDVLGWNEYFSLVSPVIFLTLAVIVVGIQVFLNEKQARFTSILHVCRYGETRTKLAKIGALVQVSVLLTAVFTLTPLAVLYFTTGLSDSGQVLQALTDFEYCQLELTILQYLFVCLAFRIVVFTALSLMTAVLGKITGSFIAALGAMLMFLAVSAVLPIGFFTAAFVNYFFERYRAVNFFGLCMNAILFCAVIFLIIITAAFAGAMLLKTNLREYRFTEKLKKSAANCLTRMKSKESRQFSVIHHSLLIWELKKLVWNPRAAVLLLILFITRCVIQDGYFTPMMSGEEVVYRSYLADLAELGGRLDDATDAYIEEEAKYIADAVAEYNTALPLYREGMMSAGEFHEISGRHNYAETVKYGFSRVREQQNYLRFTSRQYDNIGYVDNSGVDKLLYPELDIVFTAVILILLSDLFAAEYQSGFAAIQRLSRFGRRETIRAKMYAALLTITAVWIVFTVSDLILLYTRFPMHGMSFGMMSLQEFSWLGRNLPIWCYLLLCRTVGFAGAILLTILSAAVSEMAAGTLKSVVMLFLILLAPYLLSVFGMTLFEFINVKNLLAPILPDNLLHLFIYTVLTSVLWVNSVRKWNGFRRRNPVRQSR